MSDIVKIKVLKNNIAPTNKIGNILMQYIKDEVYNVDSNVANILINRKDAIIFEENIQEFNFNEVQEVKLDEVQEVKLDEVQEVRVERRGRKAKNPNDTETI
jgi:hypothetical protein